LELLKNFTGLSVFSPTGLAGIAVGIWWADRRTRKGDGPPTITTTPEPEAPPPAGGYKPQEQVRAELDAFFASRKANRKSPPL
jgi:hypothetical protein